MFANLKITQDDRESGLYHHVYVDGHEIRCVTGIAFNIQKNNIPSAEISIMPGTEFDGNADVKLDYTPETIEKAMLIIRRELMENISYYDAFLQTIVSALEDMPEPVDELDTASFIAKHIIGEE